MNMQSHPTRVLLFGDDEDDYMVVRDLLSDISSMEFILKWVSDYRAALDAILSGEFDVWLLDYRLKGRIGLELMQEALSRGAMTPIVFLTGQGGHDLDPEAMSNGAADYLTNDELSATLLESAIQHAMKRQAKRVELIKAKRVIQALSECNHAVIRIKDEVELLRAICRIVVDVGGYKMAWVGYAEEDRDQSVTPVAQYGYDEDYLETVKVTWKDAERGRGPTGTCIRTGFPGIIRSIGNQAEFAPWKVEALKRGYASAIGLPLLLDGRRLGALTIYSPETDAFDTEEVEFLVKLSGNLSYGIGVLRLRKARIQAEKSLKEAHLDLERRVEERTAELAKVNAELCGEVEERKRTEEALKEGERKFRAIFDQTFEFMGLLTVDGRLIEANRTALQFAGVQESDVIGKPFWETPWWTYSTELQETLRGAIKKAAAGEFVRYEAIFSSADGSFHYTDFSLKPLMDEAGGVAFLIAEARDINDRKRIEEELRENQSRLELALRSAHMGVWHWDLIKDKRFFDDQACRLLDIDQAKFTGTADKFFNAVHPDDREALKAALARTIRQDVPYETEYRAVWPNGSVHYIVSRAKLFRDETGQPVRVSGLAWDITGRKRVEERAREHAVFLETLFDTIPNPIFHKDANGRYTGCNRAFLEFTGKQMEEILGKTGYDMGPKDIADKYAEKDRELFEHPGKQHYEWQVQNTLGEVREVIFDKATLLDAHCAVTGLIGVISDITDRKRAEEALRESKEYLDKILNSIGDPIFVKDRQHRYVLVNDAVNVNIGLKREDLLGRTDYDFFPKEQVDIFWENDEAVFVTGEENVNEEELTDGKGAIRTIVTKKTLYSDKAANKFIVGVIRDITDRKEAELALQAAHQQLQDIVEFLPDATFVIDREKKVIYWNRAREELTGLKKQDILGQADYAYAVPFYGERTPSLIDLVTGEKPEIEKRYDYVQRRGTTLYVETFSAGAYQGKGAYLWSTAAPLFDRCGNMIGSIQVIRDISDRKRAEEAIRQSEETIRDIAAKLRKAQEISRIGSWDWNLVTQKVEISDQVYKVTGMLPGEFDGNLETLVSRFTHPDEMETVRNYIQNAMAGNDSPPMEFRAIGPGGAVRDVWLAGELIYDASGKAVRMVGTFQDTTARKQLQESLQKAKESESSRQHLDTVLRSIGDGILTVDTGMRVTYANEGLRSICPCLQGTQIGAVLEDVPCLCGGFCFAALDRIIKTRNPVVDLRVKCKTGHNLERIVILNGSQLLAPDNQFLGAVLTVQDVTRIEELERRLLERNSFRNMIGKSEKMREIYSLIESLTDLETTVLITGESGTGKELVAEALHYGGIWSSGPLVKVNCSALPEGLLESELFGHVRGAFTNAVSNRTGRFQAAEGGTIFLDEIGDIAPLTQIKLLGVLERKEFEQVGDSKTQKARVRVVAATNVDLGEKVRRGFFREDLYYRLNVMVIHLPPLRERTEDIPFLTDYFIRQMRSVCVKNITDVSNEVMQVFMRYRWPGNIRELKHALEHACILCPTRTIALEHLPKELSEGALTKKSNVDVSAEEILEALEQTGGQKARAARVLGISRRTLYRRIEQYKINDLIQ